MVYYIWFVKLKPNLLDRARGGPGCLNKPPALGKVDDDVWIFGDKMQSIDVQPMEIQP